MVVVLGRRNFYVRDFGWLLDKDHLIKSSEKCLKEKKKVFFYIFLICGGWSFGSYQLVKLDATLGEEEEEFGIFFLVVERSWP
jgi:hypothetical protein